MRTHPAMWLFGLVFLILAACPTHESMPARPESVPEEAMWIGGIDGGAWVVLTKPAHEPDHIYHAEVYGDQAGDPWYIGRLEVIPSTQPNVPLDQPDAYGVWDGDQLLLQDGRSMRAIDPFDPFDQ